MTGVVGAAVTGSARDSMTALIEAINTKVPAAPTELRRLEHLQGSAFGFPQPHQIYRHITTGDGRMQTSITPYTLSHRGSMSRTTNLGQSTSGRERLSSAQPGS